MWNRVEVSFSQIWNWPFLASLILLRADRHTYEDYVTLYNCITIQLFNNSYRNLLWWTDGPTLIAIELLYQLQILLFCSNYSWILSNSTVALIFYDIVLSMTITTRGNSLANQPTDWKTNGSTERHCYLQSCHHS